MLKWRAWTESLVGTCLDKGVLICYHSIRITDMKHFSIRVICVRMQAILENIQVAVMPICANKQRVEIS